MARRNQLSPQPPVKQQSVGLSRTNRRYLAVIVATVLSFATFLQQRQGGSSEPRPQASSDRLSDRSVDRSVGFRSQQRLDDHFLKHGKEFGKITKANYLLMAQQLRDAPLSNNVIQGSQARGNLARFDKSTGAFLAFDERKIIQTFFKPNSGEAYFRKAVTP